MKTVDFLLLIHPALAVIIVFPAIGIALNYAWQTRQRRLQTLPEGGKSKIPPTVGREHVQIGRWLSGAVVGVTLIALAYSVIWGGGGFVDQAKDGALNTFQMIFVALMFLVTIGSFILLYRARPAHWRAIFATLTGMGLIVIGCQPGVWRLSNEWYWSHYYIGIAAAILMIISLAMVEEIYRDRSLRWRKTHIILNCIATLLFIGQGMTGSRDLLEIPLSWQKPAIYQCDFENKNCEARLPTVEMPYTFVPRSHSLL
jgi:drug/metabolite transporter (DMT)-like permease